jgi:class 3 adenylate cyclase
MSESSWSYSDIGGADMGELPTGTVTLLLADVEGSTRLWETQPDAMKAAVARLDDAGRNGRTPCRRSPGRTG